MRRMTRTLATKTARQTEDEGEERRGRWERGGCGHARQIWKTGRRIREGEQEDDEAKRDQADYAEHLAMALRGRAMVGGELRYDCRAPTWNRSPWTEDGAREARAMCLAYYARSPYGRLGPDVEGKARRVPWSVYGPLGAIGSSRLPRQCISAGSVTWATRPGARGLVDNCTYFPCDSDVPKTKGATTKAAGPPRQRA